MKIVRGFTLLEVLLAMAITALVALMAYAGLSTAMTAASRHGEQARRLVDLQTTVSWITRDLRESVDRDIAAGDEREPAMWGGENPVLERPFAGDDRDNILVLTRVGWDNPRGLRRGAIQRVRYRLDADNNLWRDHWPVLDRLDDEELPQSVKMMGGVKAVTVQFLDGESGNKLTAELGGEWMPRWPMSKIDDLLPIAVQVELDVDGIGSITRIVGLANEQKN
ncbi:MAG: type II secretion system minor pseudopilin GspJ [Spongiibacteraceae bacterium]